MFTKRIPLERGVHQGCPLAPLLFALVTQPLMLILKAKLQTGKIQGLNVHGPEPLLYQLFADDNGVFFEATESKFHGIMGGVHFFERILGAKLNLRKSKIIQLDKGPEPAWFQQVECEQAQPGQLLKYLGCPMGKQFTQAQEVDYMLDKVQVRPCRWANRLLSFEGKVILLHHVIRQMPTFFLVLLDFTQDSFRRLEAICRRFLWGYAVDGQSKVPLIA
jgi:hypothetical protein